ncbi:hypothetical protein [Ralstonia phage phiITL-1]|uniref:HNS binding protein n=1 Tax=Ralstonia phage phiITL-1 TaxID=1597967 RepID=A0A0U1ZDQ0_9CAUD|nr:hypothetical protein HOR02_gp45 [Ralstonia phage phiITL-1]AJT60829.1 hypothetical protein [Ralstonia phage phiITL-1]
MNDLIKVCTAIHQDPKAFQSDYARKHAYHIAEAASRGLITCITMGLNRGKWFVTQAGLELVKTQQQ